jgi:NCS1 family nucleobase:cation symporter-1
VSRLGRHNGISGADAPATGSSLLAYGLNAQQAMACVVIGAVITGLLSVVSGYPGEIHHIGYTVTTRMSWGLRGGLFVSTASYQCTSRD